MVSLIWEVALPVVTVDWAFVTFLAIFIFFYGRWMVNVWAFWRLKPIQPLDSPKYTSKDVTVVLPTITVDSDNLRETLLGILKNDPFEILLVTIRANEQKAMRLAESLSPKKIRVLSVEKANKRRQMNMGIQHVTTEIIVFADDDVYWGDKVLLWMLAPFEDPQMGGVVTNQRLRRERNPNLVNFFAAGYLLRRNFDCGSCTYMDGSMPCLSGRSVAYRASILKDLNFANGFANEQWKTWWNNYRMNADDDNFLSRWMVSNGWKTWMQFHDECEVQTTLESNWKGYGKQCLRWSRSNWRSNIKSMFSEGQIWWRHPWSTYAVFQTTITSWASLLEPFMTWLLWKSVAEYSSSFKRTVMIFWILFVWFIVKIPKYYTHFRRYPQDLVLFPLIKPGGWFHNLIKLYAGLTLHKVSLPNEITAWGTRVGADADADDRLRMEPPPYTPFPPTSSCKNEFDCTPVLRAAAARKPSPEPLISFDFEKVFV